MARSIKAQRAAAKADAGASNAVLVRDQRTTAKGKSKARWVVQSDFAPGFNAVALVDFVSSEILEAHYQAVSKGMRADGAGAQPRLAPEGAQGRLASQGKRPNLRGVTRSGKFPADLTRTQIKIRKKPKRLTSGVEGVSATATVEPGRHHKRYVREEASGEKRSEGVEYFFVEGDVDRLIDASVRRWCDVALEGGTSSTNTNESTAR